MKYRYLESLKINRCKLFFIGNDFPVKPSVIVIVTFSEEYNCWNDNEKFKLT